MERWKSGTGRDFVESLIRQGRSGNGLNVKESPFGKTDQGILDFRGLKLDARTELLRVQFEPSDFTKASFKGARIQLCSFKRCILIHSDFSQVFDFGNSFKECIFQECNFKASNIGYKGSSYSNCIFANSNFNKAIFIRPEFNTCSFISCNLDDCDMFGSSFEECIFDGKYENIWFRGKFPLVDFDNEYGIGRKNMMQNVSFEGATLRDPTFSDDCDLSTTSIPKDGKHALIADWPSRLEKLRKEIESSSHDAADSIQMFLSITKAHAVNQKWFIINKDDLYDRYGHKNGELMWKSLTSK